MRARSQSAMEYLITYSWAILIIAVVIGVLYQLGLFSQNTFAPRAQPGSCQVFRPNGPWSIQLISLTGTCNGEEPQYVGVFAGYPTNSYVSSSASNFPTGSAARSVFAWVYTTAQSGSCGGQCFSVVGWGGGGANQASQLYMYNTQNYVYFGGNSDDFQSTLQVPLNTWSFIGYTYSAGATNTVTVCLNNNCQTSSLSSALSTLSGNSLYIGGKDVIQGSNWCNCKISNVQIYNTSLTSNEVQTLYLEGIGGAPTILQNLVGWWPLNDNGNDYGGNNANGAPTNVFFTTAWSNGYTVP